MGDHLALMAAHLRLVASTALSEDVPPANEEAARAGATLLQARAHLDERTWGRWVTEEVGLPVADAQQLMAAAEAAGASLDTLRPREL